MKLKLNKKQIVFMLNNFFDGIGEIYKCFDTCDRDWIEHQKIELVKDNYGWHDVIVNGTKYTSINTSYHKAEFNRMLEIK